MIIETTVTDSPNQPHEVCNNNAQKKFEDEQLSKMLLKYCFSQDTNEISKQNTTVIESRNQASVGLTHSSRQQ